MSFPIITTAPGKVILSGEHSAVYGKEVIASAVKNLRCYMLVEDLTDLHSKTEGHCGFIELSFPDLDLEHKWDIKQDFGTILEQEEIFASIKEDPTTFNVDLGDLIESEILSKDVTLTQNISILTDYHRSAKLVFLYLFFHIAPSVKNKKFTLKSNVPLGAGLGSSASVSVCLALAFLYCVTGNQQVNDLELVNALSLLGEKCVHGTPSGIDNAVATHGKAIRLTTSNYGSDQQSKQMRTIENFPESLSILLINTKIPKSTKTLVANVRKLYDSDQGFMNLIFESMDRCTIRMINNLESIKALETVDESNKDTDGDYENELVKLFDNIRINHGLLVTLGVSHPGLEKIKILSDEMKIGGTKLTGAGGGGCAMTVLDPLTQDEKLLNKFITVLQEDFNYDVYKSQLGGVGAYLIPSHSIPNELATTFLNEKKLSKETVSLLTAIIP